MHVALTGATGFLGRYIVRQLAAGGHTLRCWYRPGSDRTGFDAHAGRIEWLPGQLGEPADGDARVRGADTLVHAALMRPDRGSFLGSGRTDLDEFLRLNLLGSLRL